VASELEMLSSLFESQGRHIVYDAGKTIYRQGDEAKKIYLIQRGVVRIVKFDDRFNKLVKNHFAAGTLLGEAAAIEGVPYPASAQCVCQTALLELEQTQLAAYLSQSPETSLALLRSLSRKILRHDELLGRYLGASATTRVARMILDSPDLFGEIKQFQIAEMLKMKPETLSRIIRKFEKEAIITKSKSEGLVLLNASALQSYIA